MLTPRTLCVLSLTAALAAASGANAAIWYVRTGVSNSNGTSWLTPFNNLQSAINAAQAGDFIYVAAGTYKPSVERDTGFPLSKTFALKGGVKYLGGFPAGGGDLTQRNPAANATILSGDMLGNDNNSFANIGDNLYHVVYLTGNQTNTVIDGFTIRGGYADDPENFDYSRGGGVLMSGSTSGTPQFRNCIIRNNHSFDRGGGIDGGNVVIISSVFYNNRAGRFGMIGEGGAANLGNAQIINTRFLGNQATHGGALKQGTTGMTLINCLFSGNKALAVSSSDWGLGGGAMLIGDSNTAVNSCTFVGNQATALTGVDQQDSQGGGIWISSTANPAKIYNTILWDNTRQHVTTVSANTQDQAAQIYAAGSLPILSWDIIQALGAVGTGNLNTNPMFVNAKGPDNAYGTLDDDATLGPGSPALDTANGTEMPGDTFDINGNSITNEPIPLDVAGKDRYFDDPAAANTGIGGLWNDRGAFERITGCYANCDGSTVSPTLNVQDFSCFLNRFYAGDTYANCDESTTAPVLNVQDFTCFLNKFSVGCS